MRSKCSFKVRKSAGSPPLSGCSTRLRLRYADLIARSLSVKPIFSHWKLVWRFCLRFRNLRCASFCSLVLVFCSTPWLLPSSLFLLFSPLLFWLLFSIALLCWCWLVSSWFLDLFLPFLFSVFLLLRLSKGNARSFAALATLSLFFSEWMLNLFFLLPPVYLIRW